MIDCDKRICRRYTHKNFIRTGASGGIAVKLLAKNDAEVMTVCDAGAQAPERFEEAYIARPSRKRFLCMT